MNKLDIVPAYGLPQPYTAFTHAARAVIKSGHLDFLAYAQLNSPGMEVNSELPSWVPDWRLNIVDPLRPGPNDTHFSASGGMPFVDIDDADDRSDLMLKLSGYRVDLIQETGNTALTNAVSSDWEIFVLWNRFLLEITSFCKRSDEKFQETGRDIYFTRSDRETAEAFVPVAGLDNSGGFAQPADERTRDCHQAYNKVLMGSEPWGPEAMDYLSSMKWQEYRKPFLSLDGFVGLGPMHSRELDVIVVLPGAKLPYILREGDDGVFRFVGVAYVHGIMFGEFLKQPRELETFLLC